MQILTSARCARRLSNKVGLDEANVVVIRLSSLLLY